MKKNLQIGKKIALALMLLVTATVVNAQKVATVSGNWSVSATWGGTGAPTAGQTVTINPGVTVTVDGTTANVASVTVNGTLTIGTTANTARALNIAGDLVVASTGVVQIGTGNATHTFTLGGNISNAGSIDLNLDPTSICNITFNGAANQTVSGAGTRTEFNLITINKAGASGSDILEISTSNLTVPATFLTLTNGVLKVSGAYTFNNAILPAGYTIGAGNGIWLNNSNATVTAGGGDITLNGFIRVSAGTYNVGTASGDEIRYATGSAITVDGGTLNVAGGISGSAGTSAITFDMSAGTLTVPSIGNTSNTRSPFDIRATASSFTMSGGTIVMPFACTGSAGDYRNQASTVSITGGTLQFGNASTGTATDNFTLGTGSNAAPSITIVDNATSVPTVTLATALVSYGDMTINTGTSLLASGQAITVKGNWTNNGTFTSGTQTTTFDGTSLQTITGATTFSSVTVNNTGAGLSLASNVSVGGVLTLTDGVVATTPSALLTLAAGATVSGGSAASHISGPLARTGTSNFTFPIGNGTIYRPISYSGMTGGTPATVVTARYFLANPRTTFGVAGTGPALTVKEVSLCEYWDLNDGADNVSAIVGLQYSSSSPCNSNGYITNAASLVVAHWNGSSWDNLGAAVAPATTLTNMTAGATSGFSPFTIGTTNATLNPLPVSFTDVKASEKGAGVQIDWTNSTESDMSAYLIERSADGVNFSVIGQTAPRSNQFDKVSYTYIDAAPLSGTNFYRIKAIELSGKNVYSKALRVDIGRSPKGISLYPNPVRGSELTIGFSALKGQYNLNVVNTAGQVVYRQSLNHAGGTVAQTVSLPASLKAGVYNVLISGDNYKETKTFVIQ
jgi:hypothetical protein